MRDALKDEIAGGADEEQSEQLVARALEADSLRADGSWMHDDALASEREAPAPEAASGILRSSADTPPAGQLNVLDAYAMASRTVALLTKEDEARLGQQIRENREGMTASLALVPYASVLFLEALEQATLGNRPLTDVVFTPFGATQEMPDSGAVRRDIPAWRPLSDQLRVELRAMRDARSKGAREAACKRIADTYEAIEPSATILGESLVACRAIRRGCDELLRSANACQARRPPPAGQRAPRSSLRAASRRDLEALEIKAGIGLDSLDAACDAASRAEKRYTQARQHMVEANLRLAFHMARKLVGNGVSLEDLVQEAILGLMRAAEKFDHRLGFKFSTYASQWIWQGITRAVADNSRTIRVAAHMHDVIIRLNKLSRQMQQSLGRDPTLRELSDFSNLPEDKVRKALETARQPLSLDAPLQEVEDSTLGSCIEDQHQLSPADEVHEAQLNGAIGRMLGDLPKREALIVRLRHGIGVNEPYTLEQIGKVLGITRERTRQLEARAMTRLRETASPDLASSLVDF